MPATVFTASSNRCETVVSISSGEAPGRLARTTTVGKSTAGKRSTPRLKYAAAPTTTSDRTSMLAKTGLLMQISASFCMCLYYFVISSGLLSGLPDCLDRLAANQVSRLHNDRITGGNPFRDFNLVSDFPAGFDLFLYRLTIV